MKWALWNHRPEKIPSPLNCPCRNLVPVAIKVTVHPVPNDTCVSVWHTIRNLNHLDCFSFSKSKAPSPYLPDVGKHCSRSNLFIYHGLNTSLDNSPAAQVRRGFCLLHVVPAFFEQGSKSARTSKSSNMWYREDGRIMVLMPHNSLWKTQWNSKHPVCSVTMLETKTSLRSSASKEDTKNIPERPNTLFSQASVLWPTLKFKLGAIDYFRWENYMLSLPFWGRQTPGWVEDK